MVERRLSSPQEIKEKYFKVGVVIFVFNQKGEVLLVRENSTELSTGKKAGDLSVICETSKEKESWEETVIRGLEEELGIDFEGEENFFQIDPEDCFLGEGVFVKGILVRVVTIHWSGEDKVLLSAVGDGEVSVVGWEKPENLLSYPLRIGVRKVLQECLDEGLINRNIEDFSRENFLPLSISNLKQIRKIFNK